MSEWWTYGLADFLMFSPRSYARLLASFHADRWPVQPAVTAALLGLLAVWRRTPRRSAAILGVVAIAWAVVAIDFLAGRYSSIHLGAQAMAWAFAAQAGALVLAAAFTWRGASAASGGPAATRPRIPCALAALVLIGAPLFGAMLASSGLGSGDAPLAGAGLPPWPIPWEWVGFTPDATAAFTLAWLPALCRRPLALVLAVLPVASLAVGSATLHLLNGPAPWVPLAAGVLCFAMSWWSTSRALLPGSVPPAQAASPARSASRR